MRRWRWWVWALGALALAGIVAVGALVWAGDDPSTTAAGPETTEERSTTTSTTTQPTTTRAPTTEATATTAAPSTTTSQPGAVPGVVSGVTARPGGGSGEVAVDWDAVAGATGYRVLRSATAGGPFEVAADLDITTGTATAAAGVVNIWSDQHSYLPWDGSFSGPDRSPWFEYVDVGSGQRCYQVIGYNAAGPGTASAVACGSPP